MVLLRRALPGMILVAALRPFSEMQMKRTIPISAVRGSLKMNMGRLTATQASLVAHDTRCVTVYLKKVYVARFVAIPGPKNASVCSRICSYHGSQFAWTEEVWFLKRTCRF